MKNSISSRFFLKPRKDSSDPQIAVYLRITSHGSRKDINTAVKCSKELWSKKHQRINDLSKESFEANSKLESMAIRIEDYLSQTPKSMQNLDELHGILTGKGNRPIKLLEFFEKRITEIELRLGKGYSPASLQKYITTKSHLEASLKNNGKEEILLNRLGLEEIQEFDNHLLSVRNCSRNSANKYHSCFRAVTYEAHKRDLIGKSPYTKFSLRNERINKEYLTHEELAKLQAKTFKIERLETIKDLFLFSCYTGLAFVDLKGLCAEHIRVNGDQQWLSKPRGKTGVEASIPLFDDSLAILEKYKHTQHVTGQLLPVPSNQKMNAYLKEIGDLCEIEKNLTCHLARHTFATTYTLAKGVSIEVVSKMLGHSSIKHTQHYAKTVDARILEEMQRRKK